MVDKNNKLDPSPLFRVGPNFWAPAGNKDVLISNSSGNHSRLVPSILATVLNRCTSFKQLHDHAFYEWSKLSFREKRRAYKPIAQYYGDIFGEIILGWNGFPRMIEGLLTNLAKKGFFISPDTLEKWGQSSQQPNTNESITTIGFITRNRTESLEQALVSYIENGKQFDRKTTYAVFDDSPDEATRNQYKDLLHQMRTRFGVTIQYNGLEEKKKLVENLVKKGIPEPILKFALFDPHNLGWTYGANRNAFLLQTCGEKAFSVDDDTRCRVTKSPLMKEGIKLGCDGSLYDQWHFPSRDLAFSSARKENKDILDIHESTLGKILGHHMTKNNISSVEFSGHDNRYLEFLRKGGGRIYVSLNGLVGDSGSNSSLTVLHAKGDTQERLFSSEEYYRTAMNSREGWKFPNKTTIDKAGAFMTTFFGIDNREILPPFFPVFRMEDALFGEMIEKCFWDACFAHLPYGLTHEPLKNRSTFSLSLQAEEEFWPYEAISISLQSFHLTNIYIGAKEILKRIGDHLIQIGSMSMNDYKNLMWDIKRLKRAQLIYQYENLLTSQNNGPAYWKKDVENVIALARDMISRPIVLAPQNLINQMGQDQAEQLLKDLLVEYGTLCQWWPDIVNEAKNFRYPSP